MCREVPRLELGLELRTGHVQIQKCKGETRRDHSSHSRMVSGSYMHYVCMVVNLMNHMDAHGSQLELPKLLRLKFKLQSGPCDL